MENYINIIKRYIEVATEEPDKSESYIEGLTNALELGHSILTKDELVKGLTSEALQELEEKNPDYRYVNGIVTSLKEALKLEGDVDLPRYTLVTPVYKMVTSATGVVMPLDFVDGAYIDTFTMPEILIYDVLFVEFATEV